MWSVDPLELTIEERDELERRERAQTTAHRDRQRAEVVLLAADGVPGSHIAYQVGLSKQAVCKWRRRFLDYGLDGCRRCRYSPPGSSSNSPSGSVTLSS